MKRTVIGFTVAAALLATTQLTLGVTLDWLGSVDSDWHTDGNWIAVPGAINRVPIDGDRVELEQENQTAIYSVAPSPLPSYYPFIVGKTTTAAGTMTLIIQDNFNVGSAGGTVAAAGKIVQTAGTTNIGNSGAASCTVRGIYELQGGTLAPYYSLSLWNGGLFKMTGGTVDATQLLGNDSSGAGSVEISGGTVNIDTIHAVRGMNVTMTGGSWVMPSGGRARFSTDSAGNPASVLSIRDDAYFVIPGPTNGELWFGANGNDALVEVIGSDAYVEVKILQSTSGDGEVAFQFDADGITPIIITDLLYPANIELNVDASAYDPSNGLSVVLFDWSSGRFLMNPMVFDATSVTPPVGYTAVIDMGNNSTKKNITLELTATGLNCDQIEADAADILCTQQTATPPTSPQELLAEAIAAIQAAFALNSVAVDIDCQNQILQSLLP